MINSQFKLCSEVFVAVPHQANFALSKPMVSTRRKVAVKQANDQRQAVQILRALIENGNEKALRIVFDGMPKTWQKTVRGLLRELPLAENLAAVLS